MGINLSQTILSTFQHKDKNININTDTCLIKFTSCINSLVNLVSLADSYATQDVLLVCGLFAQVLGDDVATHAEAHCYDLGVRVHPLQMLHHLTILICPTWKQYQHTSQVVINLN